MKRGIGLVVVLAIGFLVPLAIRGIGAAAQIRAWEATRGPGPYVMGVYSGERKFLLKPDWQRKLAALWTPRPPAGAGEGPACASAPTERYADAKAYVVFDSLQDRPEFEPTFRVASWPHLGTAAMCGLVLTLIVAAVLGRLRRRIGILAAVSIVSVFLTIISAAVPRGVTDGHAGVGGIIGGVLTPWRDGAMIVSFVVMGDPAEHVWAPPPHPWLDASITFGWWLLILFPGALVGKLTSKKRQDGLALQSQGGGTESQFPAAPEPAANPQRRE